MRECEKEWSAEWESVRQSGSLWSYGVRVEFMELWQIWSLWSYGVYGVYGVMVFGDQRVEFMEWCGFRTELGTELEQNLNLELDR